MARVKFKAQVIKDKGPGFNKLIAELAGGALFIGVQGDEARQSHPNSDLSVGELAAAHELGLGVPERSWLRAWFDANQDRIQAETRVALSAVAARRISRKKALEQLGFKWVSEIRENIASGKVRPAISARTAERKGHNIPLLETGTVMNAITFRLFLSQIKSVADPGLREALRGVKS